MGDLRDWQKESKGKLKTEGSLELGVYCVLSATDEGITIGRGVKIGHGAKIFDKSTIGHKKGKIIIGENVWIGSNAVICPDVIIGKNSVISALTLVPSGSRIPPNEMWGGTPAKFIKKIEGKK